MRSFEERSATDAKILNDFERKSIRNGIHLA
jgi:hypothetical protein